MCWVWMCPLRREPVAGARECPPPALCLLVSAPRKPLLPWGQAGIAAYFATLSASIECGPGGLRKLLTYGCAIEGGIYCVYDAFSRLDLRCELTVPGGVTVYAVDGEGLQYDEIDAAVWRGARVSAVLRSLRAGGASLLAAGCVRRLPSLTTPAAEDAVMVDIFEIFRSSAILEVAPLLLGRAPGAPPSKERLYERAVPEDVMLDTLARHFCSTRRLARGIDFFGKLVEIHPAAVVPLAGLMREAGRTEAAIELLRGAVAELEGAAATRALLELAECLLTLEDMEGALDAASQAASRSPDSRTGWLALARCLAAAGEPARALVALHCAPVALAAEDRVCCGQSGLFPIPLDLPAGTTEPAALVHDPFVDEAARLEEEEQLLGRREGLSQLPAPQMLPRPGVLEVRCLPVAPGAVCNPQEGAAAAAYSVLVDLVSDLGWEDFLDCRSGVFEMMPDEEPYSDDGTQPVAWGEEAGEDEDDDLDTDDDGDGDDNEEGGGGGGGSSRDSAKRPAHASAPGDSSRDETRASTVILEMPSASDSAQPGPAGTARAGEPSSRLYALASSLLGGEAPPPAAAAGGVCTGPGPVVEAGPESERLAPSVAPTPGPGTPKLAMQPSGSNPSSPIAGAEPSPLAASVAPPPRQQLAPAAELVRDRAALVAGEPLAAGRLCAEWLDTLIHVLYDDMSEFMEWSLGEAREAKLREKRGGGKPEGDDLGESAAGLAQADWVRRGQLAERLKRVEDAERAYRIAVHMGFSFTAWAALARIYATLGWAQEALTAAEQIMAAHDAVQPWGEYRQAPPSVASCLQVLVAQVGLKAVRQAMDALGDVHEALQLVLHDAVRWKADGWDK